MLLAVAQLVHHSAHHGIPDIVGTLLYIVAVIATILAVIGLILSLFNHGGTARTGWGNSPVFINWLYAAVVAIIAWVVLAVLFN